MRIRTDTVKRLTITTPVALFVLSLATFAALTPQATDNAQVVSRLALTLSIVERGEVAIDRFAPLTIDKAAFAGRFYSDKPPGHSFLALPAALLVRHVLGRMDAEPALNGPAFRRHVAAVTVLTNGLLSALAVAALFLTAVRLGAGRQGALFGAVALAGATPFLGWSTAFFAHSVTASLLFFAFGWIVLAFTAPPPRVPPAPAALGLGLLLGCTLAVDLTAAPMVAVAGIGALALTRRHQRAGMPEVVAGLAAGGLAGVAPLLIYNQVAFASPFRLGYSSVVGFEGMKQGFFGISWPDPLVAAELLFGLYRGLLPVAPILVLVPLGLWRMWRRADLRPAAVVVVLALACFLSINAGYHYWSGGHSTGPRHMTAALPFLALALAFAWPNRAPLPTLALLAASIAVSLACAAASMFSPEHLAVPLLEHVLPNLARPGVPLRIAIVLAIWAVALVLWRRSTAEVSDAGTSPPRS